MGTRYPPDTRWVRARVQNFTRGYSHGRIWIIPTGMVAGGYLLYLIRTQPVAIPTGRGLGFRFLLVSLLKHDGANH
jgi:hypothetical protein